VDRASEHASPDSRAATPGPAVPTPLRLTAPISNPHTHVHAHAHGPSPVPAPVPGSSALASSAAGVVRASTLTPTARPDADLFESKEMDNHSSSGSVKSGGGGGGGGGTSLLFFGSRHEAEDFLYREDFHSFVADRTLTQLHTAFSRASDAKVYVQHRIREQGAQVADLILHRKASVFVCGDGSRMSRDVQAAIVEVLTKHTPMTANQAKAYVADMRSGANPRYVEDVWS
jgi:hypothetical protein